MRGELQAPRGFGLRHVSIFIFTAVFVLLFPAVSRADVKTVKDGHESRSPLDIASVSQRHNGSGDLVHIIHTYSPFSSRLLRGGNGVALAFDTNNNGKLDRIAAVLWVEGALRGVVVNAAGKPVELARVSRPDSRSIAVTITRSSLGYPAQYRWMALTTYRGKPHCAKGCTDTAPNHSMILHRIVSLYNLSVSVSGVGRVTSREAGINCPATCTHAFPEHKLVTLAAVPAEGYTFIGWSGDCTGTDVCRVTMMSPHSVVATFVPVHVLTVSIVGGPGEVVANGRSCNGSGPCTFRYNHGDTVTLTAQPTPWQVFVGWGGACGGTSPTCTLTMNDSTAVTAYFSPRLFGLTVALDLRGGAAGRVRSNPSGIDCPGDCSERFPSGISVTLTATAAPGAAFVGWNGTGYRDPITLISGSPNPQDQTVTAAFAPAS